MPLDIQTIVPNKASPALRPLPDASAPSLTDTPVSAAEGGGDERNALVAGFGWILRSRRTSLHCLHALDESIIDPGAPGPPPFRRVVGVDFWGLTTEPEDMVGTLNKDKCNLSGFDL